MCDLIQLEKEIMSEEKIIQTRKVDSRSFFKFNVEYLFPKCDGVGVGQQTGESIVYDRF